MDLRPGELAWLTDRDRGGLPYGVRLPDGREVPMVRYDLVTQQMYAGASLVSGAGNQQYQVTGASLDQPSRIATSVIRRQGKLACNFTSGQWSINGGAPVLTQGFTGWDGAGNQTGVVSRTGQPSMLKVVPAANTAEDLTLGSFATNMLTKALAGKIGLWVYVENQPGYGPGGSVSGSIEITVSTNPANNTNALVVGWSSNQIREGWNFLKFVMRNPLAYQSGSGVTEYHPFGVACTGFGTGADTNILSTDAARLKVGWTNMLGATLYFDSIWTDFDTLTQIVPGNDGGVGLLEYGLPVFQQYGWVGYAAFPYRVWASGSKIIPDLNSNTYDTGRQLYSQGWDVTNHTANHLANGSLTTEGELAYEVETARAWQLTFGMPRGAEFYCSPQSSTSRLSEAVISKLGFKLQRNGRKWNTSITPFGIDNPNNIGSIDMGSASGFGVSSITAGTGGSVAGFQTATKIKRAIDVAVAYGDAVFPFWHGITTTGDTGSGDDLTGDNLLLTKSAFEKSMAHIRAYEVAGSLRVCRGITGFYYGA